MNFGLGCILVVVVTICAGVHAQENYRLPTAIVPSNYDIELTPYFTAEGQKLPFTFDGIVKITLRTTQANLLEIILHSLNLEIVGLPTLVQISAPTNTIIVNNIIPYTVTQKITLSLAAAMIPNTDYLLTFNYIGQLNDAMNGFYRSSYTEKGVTKYIHL